MIMKEEREAVVSYSRRAQELKLTRGTGGNISIYNRQTGFIAITPSGVEYNEMTPQDIVIVDIDGEIVDGHLVPSSELDMHLCCYRSRDDMNSMVHTHSTFATVIACMQHDIPPVHYLIGYAGSDTVPCIPYYSFGSHELAEAVAARMSEGNGANVVLLGNHGLMAGGKDISMAFSAAEEIEFVSEVYYRTLVANDYKLLSQEDMQIVQQKFSVYGQKRVLESQTH